MKTTSRFACAFAVVFTLYVLHAAVYRWSQTKIINSGGDTFGITSDIDVDEKFERLKEVKRRLQTVVDYCVAHSWPDQSRAFRMQQRWEGIEMLETMPGEKTVAYVIDKGKSMSVCLTDKSTQKLHELNTTMFVALHELSHIMSSSWGHGPEFWENFRVILKVAIDTKVYRHVDYTNKNEMFCGTNIYSQPCSDASCTK